MAVQRLKITRNVNGNLARRDSLRLAAVDVGSNSIHMVIAQADPDGGVTTLWRMKETVGLGRISFPSRKLSADAMDRAFKALERFQQAARQRNCEKLIAVATSAVREATNGGEFVERVRRQLGFFLKVVSAREEARLIYLAVRHAMPLDNKPHLIIDIGGGSVEFIVGDETKAALLESRKLGAARMTAQCIKSDPITEDERRKVQRVYDRELAPLVASIQKLKPVSCIGTSGTLENIAAMCARGETGNGTGLGVIERAPFMKLLDQLVSSRSEERSRIRGLDAGRKDQIVAGALLVGELFKRLNLKKIELCPAALREGILLDYLGRHLPDLEIRREVPDPRRRSVLDLARRCDWHQSHGQHVGVLATRLFDELQILHGFGSLERELIEYGAMLHDIGQHIGREQHHKHSQYLILHGDLKNFSREEIRIIALIARYHRKRMPTKKHRLFRTLSSRGRRVVEVGAAILRIADGLDSTHSGVIKDLHCRHANRTITCTLQAANDAQLELWSAKRKTPSFESIFHRSLELDLANGA
jgi:exopolyphosphatase / guanosine-5'-triphosphate,3'-diphosphate pyrophosphatase